MKQGWEIKKLGEVIQKTETVDPTKNPDKDFVYVDVSSVNNKGFFIENGTILNGKDAPSRARKLIRTNDVIFATVRPTLKRIALVEEEFDKQVCSTGYFVFRPKEFINNKLLFYFLLSDSFNGEMEKLQKGASYPAVTDSEVRNQVISFPKSLPEQQRIVAILDETFASIAKAKANAEQNLSNAKELFEGYLQNVFANKGDEWEVKRLEECFKLKSGDGLISKMMNTSGAYPVFGGNGVAGLHDKYNLTGSNVIVGRVGALCGNVRHLTEKIWLTDNAFKVVDFKYEFDHSFLTYLLNFKNLRGFARQTAQPVISNSSLKDVLLEFPKDIDDQQSIVMKLDTLFSETNKLEAIYQQKLNDLEELKKSVLQKAFNGELKTEKNQQYE
jgi:type I restriction enzyme, S subunit